MFNVHIMCTFYDDISLVADGDKRHSCNDDPIVIVFIQSQILNPNSNVNEHVIVHWSKYDN